MTDHPASHRLRTEGMRIDYAAASDAALVVSMARYQHDALAEAYRRHAGPVFGLAKRLLNNQAQAEEVVQEVFLRLWNNPERYDAERGALRSYLLAQCHGRAVDMMRSELSRRRREERDAKDAPPMVADLDRELWDMALAEQVRGAMNRLQDGEKEAITLAYFGGRTYKEVAAQLGEAEGTVKSRIRSGLKRMRNELEAVGITVGGL
jgi:RNA polymerase sigma-70 factor, ECF subfamily